MLWLGLGTKNPFGKASENIMGWLIIPVLVATISDGDGQTSHKKKHPVLMAHKHLEMSPAVLKNIPSAVSHACDKATTTVPSTSWCQRWLINIQRERRLNKCQLPWTSLQTLHPGGWTDSGGLLLGGLVKGNRQGSSTSTSSLASSAAAEAQLLLVRNRWCMN